MKKEYCPLWIYQGSLREAKIFPHPPVTAEEEMLLILLTNPVAEQ